MKLIKIANLVFILYHKSLTLKKCNQLIDVPTYVERIWSATMHRPRLDDTAMHGHFVGYIDKCHAIYLSVCATYVLYYKGLVSNLNIRSPEPLVQI